MHQNIAKNVDKRALHKLGQRTCWLISTLRSSDTSGNLSLANQNAYHVNQKRKAPGYRTSVDY